MIITRTPLRISFFGGGTDYPEYYSDRPGQTLGVAITQYSYVTVSRLAPLFDHSIRVNYSRTELVQCVDEIQHPAVRACLAFMGITGGVEIGYSGDLPARTGLGSSSSFTVGLLHALHTYKHESVTHEMLAREAVYVEHHVIRERVGVQDQYICAHGGLAHVRIAPPGAVTIARPAVDGTRLEQLQRRLMLFYTGLQRHAHEILEEQVASTRSGAITGPLETLGRMVDQGLDALGMSYPLSCFGELLHQTWNVKQRLSSQVSTPSIDEWYRRAREAGAIGGKLLGAGGGGFLLLFVEPDRQAAVVRALPELRQVTVAFDHGGSRVIFASDTAPASNRLPVTSVEPA